MAAVVERKKLLKNDLKSVSETVKIPLHCDFNLTA